MALDPRTKRTMQLKPSTQALHYEKGSRERSYRNAMISIVKRSLTLKQIPRD